MSVKSYAGYLSIIVILTILVLTGPVSAAETPWIQVDPQDQIIAWEKMNADANMANLYPYALAGTQVYPFMQSQTDLNRFLFNKLTPVVPQAPSVSPGPSTDLKTIDGTSVSDLFKKAMDNYRVNPPKPLGVPGGNETIYSHQIPINW